MTEEKPALLEALGGMAGLIPAPIQIGLVKALNHLLGGLASIPAGVLKRKVQSIDDVTVNRSVVSAILAKQAAEDALSDPLIRQAAVELYLPAEIRKTKNKISVAQRAVAHIAEAPETKTETDEGPSDDWMNVFTRFAEDATSDKLQDLFARILAGEIVRPGSFGLSTLRSISELDQATAHDFALMWEKSVGDAVDYTPEFNLGEWYSRWKRLAEAGLMAPDTTTQFPPDFDPLEIFGGLSVWSPMSEAESSLAVFFSKGSNAQWRHIRFTRVGREIGSILPSPDYDRNFRQAGQSLARQNVNRVELWRKEKQPELITAAAEAGN